MRPRFARLVLESAVAASVSTALAEVMGAAIGLNLLFKLPLRIGVILVSTAVVWLLLGNGYQRIEKLIDGPTRISWKLCSRRDRGERFDALFEIQARR